MMIGIPEAQATLDELITLARQGEEVVIVADDGTPLAMLQPISAAIPETSTGLMEFE